jgi:hypothetical protein
MHFGFTSATAGILVGAAFFGLCAYLLFKNPAQMRSGKAAVFEFQRQANRRITERNIQTFGWLFGFLACGFLLMAIWSIFNA